MQIHTQSEQRLAVIFMESPLTAPSGALPSYGMGSLVGSSWDITTVLQLNAYMHCPNNTSGKPHKFLEIACTNVCKMQRCHY